MSSFTSPPDLHVFQARVWEVARQIPPGKVATYGQIASLLPPPANMDPKAYLAFGPSGIDSYTPNSQSEYPPQSVPRFVPFMRTYRALTGGKAATVAPGRPFVSV